MNYTGSLDFDMWLDGMPVIIPYGDSEFNCWVDGAPNEDQSQPKPPRRRVYEF